MTRALGSIIALWVLVVISSMPFLFISVFLNVVLLVCVAAQWHTIRRARDKEPLARFTTVNAIALLESNNDNRGMW